MSHRRRRLHKHVPPSPYQHMDGFEVVYTVTGYYDGIRTGIADFQGRPHAYSSQFDEDEHNGYDTFLLMPLVPEVFAWAMEDWHIWERWIRSGAKTIEDKCALPEDLSRYKVLEELLGDKLDPIPSRSVRVRARFNRPAPPLTRSCFSLPIEVKWTPIS